MEDDGDIYPAKLAEPEKRGRGAPTTFTPEVGDIICERIASGEMATHVCRDMGIPWTTLFHWRLKNSDFSNAYAMAQLARMDRMGDEVVEIADEATSDTFVDDDGNVKTNAEVIQRSRLRVDTRKWLMSKIAPKIYGDRMQAEVTGANGGPIQTEVRVNVRISRN